MKKVVNTLLFLHLILWVVFLAIAAANYITYEDIPDNMMPVENMLSRVKYIWYGFLAAVGIITSAILLFSVRAFLNRSSAENRDNKIIALCLSAAGTLFFYLFLISIIFDYVSSILVIAWLFCELFGCITLYHSKERKKTVSLT